MKTRWAQLGKGAIASSKQRNCRHCKTAFTIGTGNQYFCHACREQCCDANGLPNETKLYRLRKYNLLPEAFDLLWATQDGKCRLCNKPMTFDKRGSSCLHVDHNHTTDNVRGLLCRSCNNSLGFIEREEGWLQRALVYLGKKE